MSLIGTVFFPGIERLLSKRMKLEHYCIHNDELSIVDSRHGDDGYIVDAVLSLSTLNLHLGKLLKFGLGIFVHLSFSSINAEVPNGEWYPSSCAYKTELFQIFPKHFYLLLSSYAEAIRWMMTLSSSMEP